VLAARGRGSEHKSVESNADVKDLSLWNSGKSFSALRGHVENPSRREPQLNSNDLVSENEISGDYAVGPSQSLSSESVPVPLERNRPNISSCNLLSYRSYFW
jgi:hypothetical protein